MAIKLSGSHTHTQEIAAVEWIAVHNLNTEFPVVDVYILHEGITQKILPKAVQPIDSTSCKIVFSKPRTGTAAIR